MSPAANHHCLDGPASPPPIGGRAAVGAPGNRRGTLRTARNHALQSEPTSGRERHRFRRPRGPSTLATERSRRQSRADAAARRLPVRPFVDGAPGTDKWPPRSRRPVETRRRTWRPNGCRHGIQCWQNEEVRDENDDAIRHHGRGSPVPRRRRGERHDPRRRQEEGLRPVRGQHRASRLRRDQRRRRMDRLRRRLLPGRRRGDLQRSEQGQVHAAHRQGALHRAAVGRDRRAHPQHHLDDVARHLARPEVRRRQLL